ncbi:hypothetical protein ACOMSG_13285 [Macellibacteroides fermentans]|uniref:hypothetical protein n=1 Tax=Macellibacteroides fermentans TaxID=879969 RepID=UPI003B943D89
MTTIKTEQRILTLETVSDAVKLNSEARLELSGDIVNLSGHIQSDQAYLGSFNVNQGPDGKLSTNINVNDTDNLSLASNAVKDLLEDIKALQV